MKFYFATWQRSLLAASLLVLVLATPQALQYVRLCTRPGPLVVQLPSELVPPNRSQLEAPRPGRLDLNHATFAQLVALPRIGPVLAERLLQQRKRSGGFASLEQLEEVKGIGAHTLAALRPFVCLNSQKEEEF